MMSSSPLPRSGGEGRKERRSAMPWEAILKGALVVALIGLWLWILPRKGG